MKVSTRLTVAVIALLLGSGASGLLFAMPAHQEQEKLKTQKASLQREQKQLQAKVDTEESKLNGMAMETVSYFDLRKAPNKRRELESKTVETLASLTEIFNDNKIKVVDLDPGQEVNGMKKPVPEVSGAPVDPKVAEAKKLEEEAAAKAEKKKKKKKKKKGADDEAETAEAKPEIDLVHKQFRFVVRGEYNNLVTALNEIQGLPKAISVSQYDLRLLSDSGQTGNKNKKKAPKKNELAASESPTALEMGFQMSISFLMSGGPEAKKKDAIPSEAGTDDKKTQQGALPASVQPFTLAEWLLGLPADAAEAKDDDKAEKAAKPVSTRARFTFKGVKFDKSGLVVDTGRGIPSHETIGISQRKFVIKLKETTMAEAQADFVINQGGIVSAHAERDPQNPSVTRLLIETDGQHRFKISPDMRHHLRVVPTSIAASPSKLASAAKSVVTESEAVKPAATQAAQVAHAAKKPAAAPARRQVLETVTIDGGSLLVKTSAGTPAYEVVGGTKKSFVLALPHVLVKRPGKEFKLSHPGVLRARAALYSNDPVTTHLVVDTDGTVILKPVTDAEGNLRVLIEPRDGAKTALTPKAAQKPVDKVETVKTALKVAEKPVAKPMAAKPAEKPVEKPVAKPSVKPSAKPVEVKAETKKKKLSDLAAKPTPEPSMLPEMLEDTPRLSRSLSSSYSFPIARERTTGRANPFKVLPNRNAPAGTPGKSMVPQQGLVIPPAPAQRPVGAPPALPQPGGAALPRVPGAPGAPAGAMAAAPSYQVQAIMIWGKEPPLAVIQVDGKTHQVGLNDRLPGNARVKSIKADYIVVTTNGRDLRLNLKK